jgi:ABC-type oligopeptide transport system substrate-binding subunit
MSFGSFHRFVRGEPQIDAIAPGETTTGIQPGTRPPDFLVNSTKTNRFINEQTSNIAERLSQPYVAFARAVAGATNHELSTLLLNGFENISSILRNATKSENQAIISYIERVDNSSQQILALQEKYGSLLNISLQLGLGNVRTMFFSPSLYAATQSALDYTMRFMGRSRTSEEMSEFLTLMISEDNAFTVQFVNLTAAYLNQAKFNSSAYTKKLVLEHAAQTLLAAQQAMVVALKTNSLESIERISATEDSFSVNMDTT